MNSTDNSRVINSARNSATGIIYLIIITVIPFVIRTLIIKYMGEAYAGLNSVMLSLISLMNMTELGLGNAVVFFLYKPIAQHDKVLINAYLNTLRKVYRWIALIVTAIGICIMPFLSEITHGDAPESVNLYVVFGVFLLGSIMQYLFFPELATFSIAYQRSDLNNIIYLISNVAMYLIQIVAIIIYQSYSLYVIALLVQACLIATLRRIVLCRAYKDVLPEGELDLDEKTELKTTIAYMFGHQLDEKILNSIDYVTISAFWGLYLVTLYGNYMYVVTAVTMIIAVFFDAIIASVGNAIVSESVESNYQRFKSVFWMNGVIASGATVCLYSTYQLFMELWMGDMILPRGTMSLFCIYIYVLLIRKTVVMFKNANGMWRDDRFKPYVAMMTNIVLDIVMVKHYGIDGALISSIVCIAVIEIPWEARVLHVKYFKKPCREYILENAKHLTVTVLLAATARLVLTRLVILPTIYNLIIVVVVCAGICFICEATVFRKKDEMQIWIETLKLFVVGVRDTKK